jgi:hypothetical protein
VGTIDTARAPAAGTGWVLLPAGPSYGVLRRLAGGEPAGTEDECEES